MRELDAFKMLSWVMRSECLNHRRTFSRGFPQLQEQMETLVQMIRLREPHIYQHTIDNSEGLEETMFFGTFTSLLLTFSIYEVDEDTCEEHMRETEQEVP